MEMFGEIQGMAVKGTRKIGLEMKQKRRVLREINQNFFGAQIYKGVDKKIVVSEIRQNCEKNLWNLAHHPVTRKNGTENLDVEDVTITDDEELKDQMEIDVENALEETVMDIDGSDAENPLQVVEYVDDLYAFYRKMEETVMDIDGSDAENPLQVVEYVDDLYAFYRKMESCNCVSPNYMAQQGDINEKMRAILIDWLIEVHHKFDLRDETLFLTVNLIDRFLAQQGVVRKKLQLVGLVALLLACKYEEVSVPIVDDLVFISDKAYTRKEILETEKLMLNTLQFNMSVPTAFVFMNRFLKAAQADRKLELLSFFLIELCLVEYQMLIYSPSFLSASAIYTAQCTISGYKQWNKTCERHSSYSEDQLLECSKLIVSFHMKAATGRLTGIHRKFNTSKFGYVSKLAPANFLIDT